MRRIVVLFIPVLILLGSCGKPVSINDEFDAENYETHLYMLDGDNSELYENFSPYELKKVISKDKSLLQDFKGKKYKVVIPILATKYRVIDDNEKNEKKIKLERKQKEKAIRDKYINNSLKTGSTPYSYCYGKNKACGYNGCSKIKVKTPYNSDVMVTIKKNGKVYRHAYIKAGSTYSFEFPSGTYQTFFYYGKGWNPDKVMKETDCGVLKGGFVSEETFGKDSPQTITNSVLSYELILQESGNFSTKPSNKNEAF